MKRICSAALIVLTAAPIASSAAVGKKTTATISESATIVPGNSVSAYLVHNEIVTTIRDNESAKPARMSGILPLVQINFPSEHAWLIVKQIRWDKAHHRLTIDF